MTLQSSPIRLELQQTIATNQIAAYKSESCVSRKTKCLAHSKHEIKTLCFKFIHAISNEMRLDRSTTADFVLIDFRTNARYGSITGNAVSFVILYS